MALSKVMASSTSANADLTRQASSLYPLSVGELQSSSSINSTCVTDPTKNLGSMSMEELLRSIYTDNTTADMVSHHHATDAGISCGSPSREGSFSLSKTASGRTLDMVWKEIPGTTGSGGPGTGTGDGLVFKDAASFEEMTLEDFLAKAGAVGEEDVGVPSSMGMVGQGVFGVDTVMGAQFEKQQQVGESLSVLGFGNGADGGGGGGGGGGGRRKRQAMPEPVDRVAQQRQRRMIKNRESAARSRERKQAYTVELESIVMQLEEENAWLVKQQVEQTKKRFQQLMDNLIPVEQKRRPPRRLRKTLSMTW